MKNCKKIQHELSAYLDNELTPSLRVKIETHLATCADCQQELQEMKTLGTGIAALPNLKPAPRFLTEVRQKIVRGEKPEPLTWQDYAFRPLWLKIPLELAALIMIVGLVMRQSHSVPTEQVTLFAAGRTEEEGSKRERDIESETAAKEIVADVSKSIVANQAPAAETPTEVPAALVASAESPAETANKEEKTVAAPGASDATIVEDKKEAVGQLASSGTPAGDESSPSTAGAASAPVLQENRELSISPQSQPPTSTDGGRNIQLAPSKPTETVTVRALNFDEVRSHAQRLAARCNGHVLAVPQTKDSAEQTLFVELPREYVAAFKLEIAKSSVGSATGGATDRLDSPNMATTSTGVLTGNAVTNDGLVNAPGALGLGNGAPTTILEVRVVAPAD